MKKNRASRELASLNRAAFQVSAQNLRSGAKLEKFLAEIMGGLDLPMPSCTEFTCNLYAPPPPPGG